MKHNRMDTNTGETGDIHWSKIRLRSDKNKIKKLSAFFIKKVHRLLVFGFSDKKILEIFFNWWNEALQLDRIKMTKKVIVTWPRL